MLYACTYRPSALSCVVHGSQVIKILSIQSFLLSLLYIFLLKSVYDTIYNGLDLKESIHRLSSSTEVEYV